MSNFIVCEEDDHVILPIATEIFSDCCDEIYEAQLILDNSYINYPVATVTNIQPILADVLDIPSAPPIDMMYENASGIQPSAPPIDMMYENASGISTLCSSPIDMMYENVSGISTPRSSPVEKCPRKKKTLKRLFDDRNSFFKLDSKERSYKKGSKKCAKKGSKKCAKKGSKKCAKKGSKKCSKKGSGKYYC